MIVEDCNEYKDYFFTCEATFSAVSSSDAVFNNTTTAVSGVGLVGLAAFAYYYATRKREQQQAASIDLAYEEQQMVGGEDQHSSSGFQMMKDSVRV